MPRSIFSRNLRFKRWSGWLCQLTCAHMRDWCVRTNTLTLDEPPALIYRIIENISGCVVYLGELNFKGLK